jgi:dUTPase|nr:MAG TPA: dUTPase [Crassvirales sp.]
MVQKAELNKKEEVAGEKDAAVEVKIEKIYPVKYEFTDKKAHDEVLALVNANREEEGLEPLKSLLPVKAHDTDAKYDVFAIKRIYDTDKDCWVYDTCLRLEPQEGYWIALVPRSSNRKTECYLPNSVGTGDYGYRGSYLFSYKPRTSAAVRNAINILIQAVSALCSVTGLTRWRSSVESLRVENKPPFEVGDRIGQMSVEKVHTIEFIEADLNPNETERGAGGHGSTGK